MKWCLAFLCFHLAARACCAAEASFSDQVPCSVSEDATCEYHEVELLQTAVQLHNSDSAVQAVQQQAKSQKRKEAEWPKENMTANGVTETHLPQKLQTQSDRFFNNRASCSRTWGVFGQEPFTRPVVMPSRSPEPQDFSDFTAFTWGEPFVSVSNRFAFCAIPKVASSTWREVFKNIAHDNAPALASTEDLNAVFSDPRAITATMVREPMGRFLSSVLFCFNATASDDSSIFEAPLGCPRFARLQSAQEGRSMKDVVEWFLDLDPHLDRAGYYKLQSEFCELKSRIQEYRFILPYSKEYAATDALCLLEVAGLGHVNRNGRPGATTAWVNSCSDDYQGKTSTSCTSDEEIAHLKGLFTKEAARQVISHMQQDYETFNFPEPSWVADATGEWYNTKLREVTW